MQQLRIAMISLHSCPLGKLGGRDTGGMNVYIRELAVELGERGHLVDIYTKTHSPEHKQMVSLGQNVRLVHLEMEDDDEVPKIALYLHIQRFACDVENFRKAEGLRYDLIHSHYWLSGLAGEQLKSWWHVPHVTMFHTLGAVKNSMGVGEDEPELRIQGEMDVVAHCELIIAATERERDELVLHYHASPERIAVIPCGVNLELFKPMDNQVARNKLNLDGENIILFVGRLEPLKGLEQILRALTLLRKGEAPRLVIVGGDENSQAYARTLETMARDLDIEHQISFVGSVAQERLPVFYSAADLCVIPSHYESFCMVALESLACGTPIVATDVGGIRDIMHGDEIGRMVGSNSPDQLATAISELLLSSKEGRAGQSAARRATMADFSWANIADMMLGEYHRLVTGY